MFDDRGREGQYPHQADDTAVVIMIGVKQEELQGLVWAAIWRRYLLYDGGQDRIQPPSYKCLRGTVSCYHV